MWDERLPITQTGWALELELLLASPFLVALSLITLLSFLVLARAYWFRSPLAGISLATVLFITAYTISYW